MPVVHFDADPNHNQLLTAAVAGCACVRIIHINFYISHLTCIVITIRVVNFEGLKFFG